MKVRVTKLAAAPNAIVETAEWREYKLGEANAKSLPVDYELTGELLAPPRIGEGLMVFRETRNGVRAEGLFTTSPIVEGEKCGEALRLVTGNSVYLLEPERGGPAL
ncbi:MAG: hypothetical protein ACFUZC_14900 [Chthoniobacteraceae bacterium]